MHELEVDSRKLGEEMENGQPSKLTKVRQSLCPGTHGDFLKRRIPILQWAPDYKLSLLWQDLLAGFTVGLTEIPQGIAFASIAGLSPEYGLYCGFMSGFVYAVLGSCKDVNIGPTSIMALMLQDHISHFGPDMAVIMSFLSGIIILTLGILNLAFVVEFFSYPIIAGFTCGASLQIASAQIKSLFGLPGKANAFLDAWKTVFENITKIKPWDSLLGVLSIVFLLVLKDVGRRFGTLQYRPDWTRNRNILGIFLFMLSLARNALVVLIGTVLAYCLREHEPFQITGNVKAGFPPFKPPPFEITNGTVSHSFLDIAKDFGPSIAFIPLVAILEAISIAKVFTKGKTLDATQEMLAVGICNIMGSFVRSMPVTGSFTRTAVNNASGVRTTLAGIFTSIMVLLAIGFLTPSFYFVPKTTLASVIISAMFHLFDFKAFSLLWKTKRLDLVPFLATFVCCLLISLEYGILIGLAVNLSFVLYASARPKIEMIKERYSNREDENTCKITLKDTLYFPAAEFLRDTILGIQEKYDVIIIDGKYIGNIDVTVAKSLVMLVHELKLREQKIMFVNFKQPIVNICCEIDKKMSAHFETNNANPEDCVQNLLSSED